MDRGSLILICIACSCYLICEGVHSLDESCSTDAACTNTANTACSGSAPGSTCVCRGGYVKAFSGLTCEAERTLDGACTTSAACTLTPDTVCSGSTSGSTCVCRGGYLKAFGGATCEAADTVCRGSIQGSKCICASGYVPSSSGSFCEADLGIDCLNSNCKDVNAECTSNHVCVCKFTYYDSNGKATIGGTCKQKVNLGINCPQPDACGITGAMCRSNICACGEGYYDDNGHGMSGSCLRQVNLGINCPQPNACGITRAVCQSNICVCEEGYYDDNGHVMSGSCLSMRYLRVLGLVITNPQTDGFTVKWTPPTGKGEQVSGYSVEWWPKEGNSLDGGSADVGNRTSYNVTSGIKAGKVYRVKVISRNDVTQANFVDSGIVEHAAKPSTPGKLLQDSSDFDAKNQTITLKWTASTGVVSDYIVKLLEGTEELASSMFYQSQGVFSYSSMLNGHIYNVSIIAQSEKFWDGQKNTMINSDANEEEIQTVVKVPAQPVIDRLADVTPTSFTVEWEIAGPSPGITDYTITVSAADMSTLSKNVTVSGFEIRTKQIERLEEYWSYTVSITASTTAGSRTSSSKSLRTEPSAPGQVSDFNVDKTPDGNNNEWRVTWKIPEILKRNSNITSYKLKHNGTSTQPEMDFAAEMESQTYEATIGVTPETYYSVEVFAINDRGEEGTSIFRIEAALAKMPEPPEPVIKVIIQDSEVIIQDSVQTSQTTIQISVDREFVNLTTGGTVLRTGIICFNHAKFDLFQALLKPKNESDYSSMSLHEFQNMQGWSTASKTGYEPYLVTEPQWLEKADGQSSGRKKRATDAITFIIGGETCNAASPKYCNGPLQEDAQYSVAVVVCTSGGCLVSPVSGPYKTLAASDDKEFQLPLVIGAAGLGAAVIIIAVVMMIVCRSRKQRKGTISRPPALPPLSYINNVINGRDRPRGSGFELSSYRSSARSLTIAEAADGGKYYYIDDAMLENDPYYSIPSTEVDDGYLKFTPNGGASPLGLYVADNNGYIEFAADDGGSANGFNVDDKDGYLDARFCETSTL